MNPMLHDDDEDVEVLLRRLTPAPPDPALMRRLRAARPGPSNVIRILRWTAPAAAAGIALALVLPHLKSAKSTGPLATTTDSGHGPESSPYTVRIPLESRQHLMEVTDLGVVHDEGQPPFRLIRTTWVDEILYETKPGDVPEKDMRVRQEILPVSLPSY